jgi:signal transduction histidine kinase
MKEGPQKPDPDEQSVSGDNDTVAAINIPHKALATHDSVIKRDAAAMDFAKGMGHELRTPLNVIIGMCQFLERDRKTPLSPMHRDAVDRMERNARSLLESINHLLAHLRSSQSH